LHQFTRADYSAAGTSDPAEGDIVSISSAGNWYVKLAPDNQASRLGRVTKLVKTGASAAVGECVVEWLDCERVVACATDDLSTVTLLNSLIKDGNTTVVNNFDAGATTGPIIAVSKSGTSGAGTAMGMVFGL
jgi:hypothetical protein